MEVWKGEIVNLTGKDIIVANNCGTQQYRYCAKTAAVQVDAEEVYLGLLNGQVELSYQKVYDLRGLPALQLQRNGWPRYYYLVFKAVAIAASQLRRSLDDLLIPHRPIRLPATQGEESQVAYLGLMPARYWYDVHSLRSYQHH